MPIEEQKQNQNKLKKLIETVVIQSREERSQLLREFHKVSVFQEVMLKKLETKHKNDDESAKSSSKILNNLNNNLTLFYENITGQPQTVSEDYKKYEGINYSLLQNMDKRETNRIRVGTSGGQKLSCYMPDHPYPNSCASNNTTQCSQDKCHIGNVLLGSKPFQVTCDHNSDGGGWLVIQRRINGSVDFYRSWADYKDGFGDLDGEFWLGLDKINAITTTLAPVEFLIKLKDHDDVMRYAKYNEFVVGNEAEMYELRKVGQYEGNAGDPLSPQKGYKFSTMDKDNDVHRDNCAVEYKGAWWYYGCRKSNLNGLYYKSGIVPTSNRYQGIHWSDFHGFGYSLKFVQMLHGN